MINTKATSKASSVEEFNSKHHWENIYSNKKSVEVSWYQQCPEYSLELIKSTGIEKSARIIDIGGGASTLVDFLLATGYKNLTVLDIAKNAIEQAKARLNKHADSVEWLEQDITKFLAEQPFELWHDRAVFHFLTDADDRLRYVQAMSDALKPGGHVIVATFDLDGPKQCSGIDVVRYSPESMAEIFGDGFKLVETCAEEHISPAGDTQKFVYCQFVRLA